MDQVEFAGEVTYEDFKAALKLHQGMLAILGWIRFPMLVAFAMLLLYYAATAITDFGAFGVIFSAIPLIIIVVAIASISVWQRRRLWRNIKNTFQGLSGKASEAGVELSTPSVHSEFKWFAFVGQKHNADIALLYRNGTMFQMIPRTMFKTAEDWETFISLVNRYVPVHGARENKDRAICDECAYQHPKEEMIELHGKWVCSQCKDVAIQKLKEGVE